MKNLLLLIIFTALFTACKKDAPSLPPQFRIENATPFLIDSARVKLGTSQNSYPAINAGEVSEFKTFNDYDYPNIKLRVNNKDIEFTIMPIDGSASGSGSGENIKSTGVITYNALTGGFGVHFRN